MKMRKTLSHNLLITELFNQLTFPVKVRINGIIIIKIMLMYVSFVSACGPEKAHRIPNRS